MQEEWKKIQLCIVYSRILKELSQNEKKSALSYAILLSRQYSPTSAFKHAHIFVIRLKEKIIYYQKFVRWLTIIRRDHPERIEETISLINTLVN